MGEQDVSDAALYETRVILNPKNIFSLKPTCTLRIRASGMTFESSPPLDIQFDQIRSTRVSQITDGIIEHGVQRTVFRGASIWTGTWEAPQIIRLVNRIRREGPGIVRSGKIQKEFNLFKNYGILAIVVVLLGVQGGALGGLWGALCGMWAQRIVSRKPNRSWGFKIAITVAAIIGAFIGYLISVVIFVAIFPGLVPEPKP